MGGYSFNQVPIFRDPFAPNEDDIRRHQEQAELYRQIIESNKCEVRSYSFDELSALQDCIDRLIDLEDELKTHNRLPYESNQGLTYEKEQRDCQDLILDLRSKQNEIENRLKNESLELGKRSLELNEETKRLTVVMNRLTWVVVGVALFQLLIGIASIIIQINVSAN